MCGGSGPGRGLRGHKLDTTPRQQRHEPRPLVRARLLHSGGCFLPSAVCGDAVPSGANTTRLGIVGAAIAVAILVGVCLGVYQAMKPEAKSRDESLSVVAPDTDNYTVM